MTNKRIYRLRCSHAARINSESKRVAKLIAWSERMHLARTLLDQVAGQVKGFAL